MSKYITHFQTEAAYQSALPTLDLPNVSLVDELGEVHYHRALYGAHVGDIALYDVAEAQKIVVTAEDWNLTTYPTASYPIIGVVVADETPTGLPLVATHPFNADGSKASAHIKLKWQNDSFDWGLTKNLVASSAKTDLNGKTNTATIIAAIKAYDLSHGTDNITGKIGQGIQLYSTTGTNPGDWYVPACGELNTLYANISTVNSSLAKIYQADSSLALSLLKSYDYYSTSSEGSSSYNVVLERFQDGNVTVNNSKVNDIYVRLFYKLT